MSFIYVHMSRLSFTKFLTSQIAGNADCLVGKFNVLLCTDLWCVFHKKFVLNSPGGKIILCPPTLCRQFNAFFEYCLLIVYIIIVFHYILIMFLYSHCWWAVLNNQRHRSWTMNINLFLCRRWVSCFAVRSKILFVVWVLFENIKAIFDKLELRLCFQRFNF